MILECRKRWTKTGRPSKRKSWFRSPASRARFKRAMRKAKRKKK